MLSANKSAEVRQIFSHHRCACNPLRTPKLVLNMVLIRGYLTMVGSIMKIVVKGKTGLRHQSNKLILFKLKGL